ncbi:hypothetical protein GCM10017559_05250 [Streptosporangium longisporum]|uniref:ABC transmembrane type-1 domain-containing protein n=1 Tax=Streptosporangium longisporum TaxID=46187 RepID=A0ABN3XSU0_9ACTN
MSAFRVAGPGAPPGAAQAVPRRHRRRPSARGPRPARSQRWYTPWPYLLAPLALLVLFTYVPRREHVPLQPHRLGRFQPCQELRGGRQLRRPVHQAAFLQVLTVSLFYLAGSAVQMVVALYFATVLSFGIRLRNLFKGILFFPYLINGVAIGFVFLYFFQPGGTLDTVLGTFGSNRACGSAIPTWSTPRWPASRCGASWA